MMKCEKCQKEHDGSFGSSRFCSRKCANSRTFSEESRQKKSIANIKRLQDGKWGWMNLTASQRQEIGLKRIKSNNNKILTDDFATLKYERRRKRILIEQQGKCHRCGIDEWLGKKIPLEIEHINGNHQDNSRENLVALCPNCHSLTSTWRGRNKTENKSIPSDSEIVEMYSLGMTIRQILLKIGYAAKGDNYKKIKNILKRKIESKLF